jgi:C-terminal processing protease CtpA/Prc
VRLADNRRVRRRGLQCDSRARRAGRRRLLSGRARGRGGRPRRVRAQRLAGDEHDEIIKKLTRRYQRTLRNLKQFESDEVLQLWLDAMGHAYDPHTDYLGKRDLEQFAMQMNLRLFGIGATLQAEDGYTVIREIRPGTPAERSKQIKVGDKVVAVAQGQGEFVDVIDEKLSKVVAQIRGEKGTEVRLSIIPAGADSSVRKVVSILRDEIRLEDQEAKAKLAVLNVGIGYPDKWRDYSALEVKKDDAFGNAQRAQMSALEYTFLWMQLAQGRDKPAAS